MSKKSRCHYPGCDKRPNRNNPSYTYIGHWNSNEQYKCQLRTCTDHTPAQPDSVFGSRCAACSESLFKPDRGPVIRVRHVEDYVNFIGQEFFHAWCVDTCSVCCFVYPIVDGKTVLKAYSSECPDRVCYHCTERPLDLPWDRKLAAFRIAKPRTIGNRWWKEDRRHIEPRWALSIPRSAAAAEPQ
jgi:hypothetical protein